MKHPREGWDTRSACPGRLGEVTTHVRFDGVPLAAGGGGWQRCPFAVGEEGRLPVQIQLQEMGM